jgi:hypothetical protein
MTIRMIQRMPKSVPPVVRYADVTREGSNRMRGQVRTYR